jgi:hypothetical protein
LVFTVVTASQLQPPRESAEQVLVPASLAALASCEQVNPNGLHPLGKCSWTVSTTLSVEVNVSSVLKVKVPLYANELSADAPVHPLPALLRDWTAETHVCVTFQVPTMLPPQGGTLGQPPPLPPVPAV